METKIPIGGRNAFLHARVMSRHAEGQTPSFEALEKDNQQFCSPPLPLGEVQSIIDEVALK